MLKLLHAQYLLKHIKQLLLGQDHLAVQLLLHARGSLVVIVSAPLQNTIEFGHPRRQHRFLAESVNLGQRSHTFFNIVAEHLKAKCLKNHSRID